MFLLFFYLWDLFFIKKGVILYVGLLKFCEIFILYIINVKYKLNFR